VRAVPEPIRNMVAERVHVGAASDMCGSVIL
jgi:hypothetical protein